ncbi:hypothetical protein SO802_001843 [Lithocarpus litseifolius]|uniref:Uncharacterized protein n=1 Tax=Lithocarpus litseifolius TaxID=425828 RepID=A0AAW2DXF4_9ROSI
MSEVRCSELEMVLSSSVDLVEVEEDTAVSGPREVRAFSALGEEFKKRSKLKSRYRLRVEAAIEYARTIDNFDIFLDSRNLALYCLGPEPSAYNLRTIEIEEKKKMMKKFNQGTYAKMRSKKNEPLSNLRKRTVRIVEKGVFVTPPAPVTEPTKTASLATSVEEVTPISKRQRVADKWAQDVFTAEEFKVFSGVPSNEIVDRHIHKLIQVLGETIHISLEYLSNEAKTTSAGSRVVALEAENSKLRKDLIAAMDKDEQLLAAKEKIKTIVAKSFEAFQLMEEYNTVLFGWYYKGFELLRQYLVKHLVGVDLENLDLEEVDKEMTVDEAS